MDVLNLSCQMHSHIAFPLRLYCTYSSDEVNYIYIVNSRVVYTAITGGYDILRPPAYSQNVDYVCFSDQPIQSIGLWRVVPIPKELQGLSKVKQQRILKICAHRYLKQYRISVWVDGSIQVVGDINKFISQYDLEKSPLYARVHPSRDCLYEEGEACLKYGKDSKQTVEAQLQRYRDEGFPAHAGMFETGVLLRKHNDPKCILACNDWAVEVLNGSHRDQLSFNYACRKNHFFPGCLNKEFRLFGDGQQTFKFYGHRR